MQTAIVRDTKTFVLVITGPAGSGKTTVARNVAKQLNRTVNIDADHIKHMIPSGFYKDESAAGGWGFNEWGLVGDAIGLLTTNFLEKGYRVIINGYLDEAAWQTLENRVAITHKVLLLPDLQTAISRDAMRSGDLVMGEAVVSEHYRYFTNNAFYQDSIRLDSAGQEERDTVRDIVGILENDTALS